jgi:hypothetical protein
LTRDVKPNLHHLVSSVEQLRVNLHNKAELGQFNNVSSQLTLLNTNQKDYSITNFTPITTFSNVFASINSLKNLNSSVESADFSIFKNNTININNTSPITSTSNLLN